MRRKNIDFELQGRARKYLKYINSNDSNPEEEERILQRMTTNLKNELNWEAKGKILSQIPFFTKNFSKETIHELSLCMREVKFSPEEFIYQVKSLIFSSLICS